MTSESKNTFKYGQWESEREITLDHKSFVYQVTLIINDEKKYYIGYKTLNKNWERYTTSQNVVKSNLDKVVKYEILKLFNSIDAGYQYEDDLLIKYDCINSNQYLNMCRKGAQFNVSGRKMTSDEIVAMSVRNSRSCIGPDGVEYKSLTEASTKCSLNRNTLKKWCFYERYGWKYKRSYRGQ